MTFKKNWEAQVRRPIQIDQLKALLLLHYKPSTLKNITIIQGGCANVNACVELTNAPPIILRIYIREPEMALKEQNLNALLPSDIPTPRFQLVNEAQGFTYAIVDKIPGISLRDYLLFNESPDIPSIMNQVGQTLAKIAAVEFPLSGFFNHELVVTEPTSHQFLLNYIDQLLNHPHTLSTFKEMVPILKALFASHEALLSNDTKSHLVHGDYDPANLLVRPTKEGVQLTGVLDWEFAFAGSSLFDVANMLRYAHHLPSEYETHFLNGLTKAGFQLPQQWKATTQLLSIVSLLDSLCREGLEKRPNQEKDIQSLIHWFVSELS